MALELSSITNHHCQLCPMGEYQNLYGQVSCKICDVDSPFPVATQPGSFLCQQCAVGKRSHNTTHCESCPLGTYGYITNVCTLCPVNTYGTEVGATTDLYCEACPGNTITFGMVGAQLPGCGLCAPGKFFTSNAEGNTCQPCHKGSCSKISGAIDSCTQCPLGHLQT